MTTSPKADDKRIQNMTTIIVAILCLLLGGALGIWAIRIIINSCDLSCHETFDFMISLLKAFSPLVLCFFSLALISVGLNAITVITSYRSATSEDKPK